MYSSACRATNPKPSSEGEREEDLEDPAVAGLERVVRDRDRHARSEQDGGVDRRQPERGMVSN